MEISNRLNLHIIQFKFERADKQIFIPKEFPQTFRKSPLFCVIDFEFICFDLKTLPKYDKNGLFKGGGIQTSSVGPFDVSSFGRYADSGRKAP